MRDALTTLLITEITARDTTQTVTQYCRGDMEEIFTDAQRAHLAKGNTVQVKGKFATLCYVDLVAFHAANKK